MDEPLVCQLFGQEHGWLATFGSDKRCKDLTRKHLSRCGFPQRNRVRPPVDDWVDRPEVEGSNTRSRPVLIGRGLVPQRCCASTVWFPSYGRGPKLSLDVIVGEQHKVRHNSIEFRRP